MADNSQPKRTLNDLPIGLRSFGLIFFSAGTAVGLSMKSIGAWLGGAIFGGVGLQMASPDRTGPLFVLSSPNGVYLAFLNRAAGAQAQAAADLGAALVRAQGTGAATQTVR